MRWEPPPITTVAHFTLSAETIVAHHCGKCRICQKGFEVGDEVTFIRVKRGLQVINLRYEHKVLHSRYEHKRCWEKQS